MCRAAATPCPAYKRVIPGHCAANALLRRQRKRSRRAIYQAPLPIFPGGGSGKHRELLLCGGRRGVLFILRDTVRMALVLLAASAES